MRHLLPFIAGMLLSSTSVAQFSVGSGETIHVLSGTIFSADSLVLIPGTPLSISNNILTHNYTPIQGIAPGSNSIARVYYWTASIPYTGQLGLVYSDPELAGNTESLLQVSYRAGSTWTTATTSTVNTTTNYVTFPAPLITFNAATATNVGVALPIVFNSFEATMKEDHVWLNWDLGDRENLTGFDVLYANDGRNWLTAGTVLAPTAQMAFNYEHTDVNFSQRYYRLAAHDLSGSRKLSPIVLVKNDGYSNGVAVLRLANDQVRLLFKGERPTTLQVFDMKGQLLRTQQVVQQQVDVKGLAPGVYIVRYAVNGERRSKQIRL